jgi:solute carrier family 25 protein 44
MGNRYELQGGRGIKKFGKHCSRPFTIVFKSYMKVSNSIMYFLFVGLIDAGSKIYRTEGVAGLYRGFWVSSVQIFSGVAYIGTYESTRHILSNYNVPMAGRSLLSGSAASLVGQTIIVPFDVISQHLMFIGLAKPKHGGKVSIISSLL